MGYIKKSRRTLSTHDLTRRSTRCGECGDRGKGLSTHDLTRRSTFFLSFFENTTIYLSTHDLTRRSTLLMAYMAFKMVFQLTTSQGGRRTL